MTGKVFWPDREWVDRDPVAQLRFQARTIEPPSHSLTKPVCSIIQLAHQPQGVMHRVVLDPEKVQGNCIRIGDWPGDEAFGWQFIQNIRIVEILGTAELEDGKTKVTHALD